MRWGEDERSVRERVFTYLTDRALFVKIIFWPLAVLGGFFVVSVVRGLVRQADSESWPSAPGTVIEAKYELSNIGERVGEESSYRLLIKYRYVVKGQTYTSNRLRVCQSCFPWDTIRRKLAQYPVGSTVTVYYDPDDPSFAVLEPGRYAGYFGLVIAAAILCGSAGMLLLLRHAGAEVARLRQERSRLRRAEEPAQ